MLSRVAVKLYLVAMSFLVAGAAATVQAGDPGMVVLGMGGGSLKDAVFKSSANGDASFSFFAGIDKRGNLKGSVFFKRLYPGRLYESGQSGTRAVVSTEITLVDFGEAPCPWVSMEGLATLHHTWGPKPARGEIFHITVWDCDATGGGPDKILYEHWSQEPLNDDNDRPAITLFEPTELTGGNINILNEGFPD